MQPGGAVEPAEGEAVGGHGELVCKGVVVDVKVGAWRYGGVYGL